MTQALITVNTIAGSNTDLPIGVIVQLNNTNAGGETSYAWTILDQPPGTADTLSSATIQNPTFTPKKEGTYLIQVVVNASLADEQTNRVVCAVKQLKTRTRVPAAGETTEADTSDGYAVDANAFLRLLDTMRADPGVIVVQMAGPDPANGIVHFTGSTKIKSGLPGEESIVIVATALATQNYIQQSPVAVVLAAVDGGALGAGRLAYVRLFGLLTNVSLPSITVGDRIYVNDTGDLSRMAGSKTRQVGVAVSGTAGVGDIYFNGLNA